MSQLLEIRSDSRARALELVWSDGARACLPHVLLRSRCGCAECRSTRRSGAEVTVGPDVTLVAVTPYGPNAVQLAFSDGHERGLFPFSYLRELAQEQ